MKKIEIIVKFFKGILSEGGKISSNRFALLVNSVAIFILFLSVAFHITWNTVCEIKIQFTELGYFLGGMAAYIGAVLYGKVSQKKVENGVSLI